MKALELIKQLSGLVARHGNLCVRISKDTEAAEYADIEFKSSIQYTASGEMGLIEAEYPDRFIIR